MSLLTVPGNQNKDRIRTLQPKIRKVEPAHNKDDDELSSADEDYHFIKLKSKPNGKKLRYQPNRSAHKRNQTTQQKQTNQQSGGDDYLPDILHVEPHNVKMRPVDFEKIYSQKEKARNAEMIGVFFDKFRKLKRHADGSMLIKKFVSPIYSSLKMRNLSPDQKELQASVIMKSYDVSPEVKQRFSNQTILGFLPQIGTGNQSNLVSPTSNLQQENNDYNDSYLLNDQSERQSFNRSQILDSVVSQSKESQFLFGNQNEIFNSTYLERIQRQRSPDYYDDDEQDQDQIPEEEDEQYQTYDLEEDPDSIGEQLKMKKQLSQRKIVPAAQSPRMYPKDYTRIGVIKQRRQQQNESNNIRRPRQNSNTVTFQDIDSLNNSIQQNSKGKKTSGLTGLGLKIAQPDKKEEMRIIAPFVENHFKSMTNSKVEVLMAHDFKMRKIQQKKEIYQQNWNNFEQQTMSYSNFLASAGFDKSQNFKLVGLRKQFD